MKILKQSVKLLAATPDPEKLIESAARTCWRSEGRAGDDTAPRFIEMLLERGHESPLEHASATFRIACDRGVMVELTRHRLASFSVESTRYVRYEDGLSVIEPPGMDARQRFDWEQACREAEYRYMSMLEHWAKPEIARSVLPLCLACELVATANLREWRHVLRLRLDKAAHPQIREVAGLIRDELVRLAPTVFCEFAEGK